MAAVVWYRVRELDRARAFYKDVLGFEEAFVDFDDRWSQLQRGATAIALAEGEPTRKAASHTSTWTTSRPRRSGCARPA